MEHGNNSSEECIVIFMMKILLEFCFFDGLEILTSPCLDGARNVTMDFQSRKKGLKF